MDIPLGFKFHPEPYECLEYLTYKVMGCPLPCNGVIFDLNPYNLKHLPDIFSAVENKGDLYLFTKLSRKGTTGSKRINRRVGKGTWHASQNRDVRDRNGRRLIGKATDLKYIEKGSMNDSRYLMTEYTLLKNTSLQYDPLKDYVLCHLYQSPRWKNPQQVHKSSNQEPAADLRTPSSDATESISSMKFDMEMPTNIPSTSASNASYVDEPLAMETAYSQPSDDTSFDPDILNTPLPIDFWFNDPSLNNCFELINTDPFEFSKIESSPFF